MRRNIQVLWYVGGKTSHSSCWQNTFMFNFGKSLLQYLIIRHFLNYRIPQKVGVASHISKKFYMHLIYRNLHAKFADDSF